MIEKTHVSLNESRRNFTADAPTTRWVAAPTYICTAQGWLYLTVVLDLFSRMVGGWSMTAIQDATLVLDALRMAIARRREAGLLHHTDRGSTDTSEAYQVLLQQEAMTVSMSRTADCYDNAAMESFFITSKESVSVANYFRHEHKPGVLPLITLKSSIIAPGDIPPSSI